MGSMDDHTVTGRVVAVLDAVAAQADAMTLAELTRATGIPKPTVRRIAADLVARRLLERRDDGFRLGSHLLDLGARAARHHGLRDVATPYVQELFARTGEVAWIAAATERSLTLVDSAFGTNRAQAVRQGEGTLEFSGPALLMTAAGRVLLADRPDLVEQLRPQSLPKATARTTTSWPQLIAALAVARDTGTAIEHEQSRFGYSCIAAGIRDQEGSLVGVLGITGRIGSWAPERIARPLVAAAASIESSLKALTP
ncbi:IclR family transcriptional regulator C-terminal domain-containing protein [Pseudofrankia sp. BMG5.36]|uniref:IclR family transcriptional regulator n=1 Tax=Pseudofrankia sp. BMG5.36 TaxID=1834512 RepID=UPI0008DB1B4E|nr:IclR family transcriptional regulator C-terminal domain-containing protein [Pseudofrankia sp. BMG5.36]OHV73005.1 hypothetical protein BCD48_33790 [Pseudofrankia sp. BMG5.36]